MSNKARKESQVEKVFKIVKRAGSRGITTPLVIERGLKMGIGNADRRLRELQEMDAVESYSQEGTRVKRWTVSV